MFELSLLLIFKKMVAILVAVWYYLSVILIYISLIS